MGAAHLAAVHERKRMGTMGEKDSDEVSVSTEVSTAATSCLSIMDEEVDRLAAADKNVRKFAKVLRDISKLEAQLDLDKLQKAKVARKPEIQIDYDTAFGLSR